MELSVAGPASANAPPTGLPTISGTARVGETLTASVDGIADADGLDNATFAYQWLTSDETADTAIKGAAGATYTVAATDMGKTIKVRVTFTDGGDTEETLVSEATVAEAPSGALTGFTLVDAGSATDHGALVDGGTVTLDDPANGNFGVRVETAQDAEIGSVKLELSGTKTVSRTENIAPYSLYGDADGAVHGASLPAGSYTLVATAHAEARLEGGVIGTLEVSFTVQAAAAADEPAAEEDAEKLTARLQDVPDGHGGTGLGGVHLPGAVQRERGDGLQGASGPVLRGDGRRGQEGEARGWARRPSRDPCRAFGLGGRDGDPRGRAGLRHGGRGLHLGRQGALEHGGGDGSGSAGAQGRGCAGPGGPGRGAGVRRFGKSDSLCPHDFNHLPPLYLERLKRQMGSKLRKFRAVAVP